MDKFFKAIGRFFKGIWDWIKSTAWVQPLLIVVIVFAVIFSFSSSSPLMKWIKSLSNSDTTGQFFDKHEKIAFHDLYKDIYNTKEYGNCIGKRPDGSKAGTALNSEKYDGYTYVLFINNDESETTIRSFYDNSLKTNELKSHFYVIDFRDEKNLKSHFEKTRDGKWEATNDAGAEYYNYLVNHLFALYNDENLEYQAYNEAFNKKYGYNAKCQNWELKSTTKNDAINDLRFPLICKYQGEKLIDFRFCNNVSTDYDGKDLLTVLNNFHEGI